MNSLKIKKVFISGPMSGYKNFNKEAFFEAEAKLKEAGFSVFNPAWLEVDNCFDTSDLLAIDLAALSRCNAIYQLPGWERSKGANAEYYAAVWGGLEIINHEWLEFYIEANNNRRAISNLSEKEMKDYLEGKPKHEKFVPAGGFLK